MSLPKNSSNLKYVDTQTIKFSPRKNNITAGESTARVSISRLMTPRKSLSCISMMQSASSHASSLCRSLSPENTTIPCPKTIQSPDISKRPAGFKSETLAKRVSDSFDQQSSRTTRGASEASMGTVVYSSNGNSGPPPIGSNSTPAIVPFTISEISSTASGDNLPLPPLFVSTDTTQLTLHPECWTADNKNSIEYFEQSSAIDRIGAFSPVFWRERFHRSIEECTSADKLENSLEQKWNGEKKPEAGSIGTDGVEESQRLRLDHLFHHSTPSSALLTEKDISLFAMLSKSRKIRPTNKESSSNEVQAVTIKKSSRQLLQQPSLDSKRVLDSRLPVALVGRRPSIHSFRTKLTTPPPVNSSLFVYVLASDIQNDSSFELQ